MPLSVWVLRATAVDGHCYVFVAESERGVLTQFKAYLVDTGQFSDQFDIDWCMVRHHVANRRQKLERPR
ncbi:hypothetical protein PBI_ZOEJ_35 [Mycobacterium phage ZoeJ]|uniref:Uncharacterized protein n=1 Tax=Mycobacterium phage ZoeJ TaxID=1486427 RepID=A0A023W696_9CAUD|nr:hypothetical protein PBI_ZOEJ_35 [Mycobacterium phage ZoeJ]AHY26859.1 hypothetical protein PBI_ZOEJ_35 [Mycobacterium phage ZoeJ]